MSNNTLEQTETVMYAVFRNNVRVSDSEYDSKLDAQRELDYWAGIIKRYPDGSKLEIRPLNQKRVKN
jgi:hypothetical protein